jgi:hypothetical protein
VWLYSLQPGEWQKLFSLCFSREEKQLLFRAGNFCKAKDKEGGAGKRSSRHHQSHEGDNLCNTLLCSRLY